jgi:hypothetical protein
MTVGRAGGRAGGAPARMRADEIKFVLQSAAGFVLSQELTFPQFV